MDPALSCPEFVVRDDIGKFKVPVMNKTDTDVTLDKYALLGTVQVVAGVSQLDSGMLIVDETSTCSVEITNPKNHHEGETKDKPGDDDDWLPEVDLSHLAKSQRELVENC